MKPLAAALLASSFAAGIALLPSCGREDATPADWRASLAAGGWDEMQFTTLCAAAIREELDVETHIPKPLRIECGNGPRQWTWLLDNVYQASRAPGASPVDEVSHYLDSLAAQQKTEGKLDERNLMLIVRDRTYIEFAEQQGDGMKLPKRPLIADLFVVVAEDTPQFTRILSVKTLEEAGFTFDTAYVVAEKNLRAKTGKIRLRGEKPLFTIGIGEDLDASLLLIPKVWERLQGEVSGEVVVAAAARDTVIFTGTEEEDGVDRLRSLVAQITASGHHLISDTILVWRQGQWVEFDTAAPRPK